MAEESNKLPEYIDKALEIPTSVVEELLVSYLDLEQLEASEEIFDQMFREAVESIIDDKLFEMLTDIVHARIGELVNIAMYQHGYSKDLEPFRKTRKDSRSPTGSSDLQTLG